jgi:flagellar capping protein FliD
VEKITEFIHVYNTLRPHLNCQYHTPENTPATEPNAEKNGKRKPPKH